MNCKICKTKTATQNELISVGVDVNLETDEHEVNLIFIALCKACSIKIIGYDQNTVDELLNTAREAFNKGAKVNVIGRNENLYNISKT